MKHQATRDLYAYWNELRQGRTAPERAEIEPTAIRHVLADTFMLEIDTASQYPIRLAGTRVNGIFDADQKGRSFLELWRAEERRNVAAVLLTVTYGACPVVAGGVATPRGQSQSADFEFLFLPLRHHGKTQARILGIVTPASTREPGWLGLLPPGPLALRSLRIIEDSAMEAWEKRPQRMRGGPYAGVAADLQASDLNMDLAFPTGSLLVDAEPPRSSRPALRVIQGGRPV